MSTALSLASSLAGEQEILANVIAHMSDHSRKREYAHWLSNQGDRRGAFLNSVLDAWEDGDNELPLDDTISAVWQRTCGVTLLQHMRSGGMDALTNLFQFARPAVMINLKPAEDELPVGVSKFGGKPDLSPDQPWPEYKGKPHAFVGQINLEEIAKTQASVELPSKGVLSLFVFCDVDSGELPAGKILYTAEASSLKRRTPDKPLRDNNEIAPECALEFEETLDMPYVSLYDLDQPYADQSIGCRRAKKLGLTFDHVDVYEELRDALMSSRENRSHLLGWSHPQVAGDDPVEEDWRNLVTVASEEECDWSWGDGHQLFYSIAEDDLKAHIFERICAVDG